MTRAAALLVGCVLASLPYLVYGTSGHSHAPHSDHAARHGGEVFMLGDYHLELVRGEGRVEIFLSDSVRRPQRPARGEIELANGSIIPMRWQNQRLVTSLARDERVALYRVIAADRSVLPLAGDPTGLLSARR